MGIQDQSQNHSGQEVHSMVHLCPKCGWPYPNPHPSAKHRRSHNRVCGTIEGYKSAVDSGSCSNEPEDDHDHDYEHSDEEHHTPSPDLKVLERSLNNGGNKEISERPVGSKEEVAVIHFPDGAPTPQVEVSSFTVSEAVIDDNKNLVVDLNGLQAHEDRTMGEEIGQKTSASSDSSTQNLLEPKNVSQELIVVEIKEPSTGSAEQGEAEFVEVPNDLLNQNNGVPVPSSFCVGSENPMNSSDKADGSTDSNIVNEQSVDDLMKEGDIIAKAQTRLMSSLPFKGADVVSAVVPSKGFTSMEEGIDAVSTAHQSETPDSVSIGIFLAENLKEDKNFPVYVVPKDIPVIEHPERLIEGYKDYSAPKIRLPQDMNLPDTILQKEDSFVAVSKDSPLLEMKVQKEVGEVPSSDCILPKDKSEPNDNLKELKEGIPIIQEDIVCEKTLTTNESRGDNTCKSEKLEAKEIDQDLSTVDLPVESSISAFHEIEAPAISIDTSESNLSESDEKHCPIAPEISVQQNEVQDKSVTNLIKVARASDVEKPEIEWVVVPEIETMEVNFEGHDNFKATAAESAVSALAVESTHFDGVSGNDTSNVTKDVECSEEKGELSVRDAENNPESTIKYHGDKEAGHVQGIDTVSSGRSSVTVENNQSRYPSATTAKIPIEDERVDDFFIAGPVVSAPERSTDLNSQTDSLEADWGSISVLSTQSDPFIATESELLTPAHEVASMEAGESIVEAEEKGSEKTDAFEAPSFMTLVEHGVGANQTGGALAQQGGKKDGEIISNLGAGKHHSPLKNLLVEATQESKLMSSSQKESFTSVQKDETTAVATVGKILAADDRKSGSSVKEWDSPARYPADIKREKRKVKGHWMPFICCSSVN